MQKSNEEKLKSATRILVRKQGESILAEVNEMRLQNISYLTPHADKTVRQLIAQKSRPKMRKALLGSLAAAACIAITIRLASGIPDGGTRDIAGISDSSSAPSATSEQADILPLSFTLPADYMIAKSDFDNGMSIYALDSEAHGNVVLTMHYEDNTTSYDRWADYDEVIIDGTPVPAKVQSSYMLLTFEKNGLRYTLSSKDDLGALAAFYRSIEKEV